MVVDLNLSTEEDLENPAVVFQHSSLIKCFLESFLRWYNNQFYQVAYICEKVIKYNKCREHLILLICGVDFIRKSGSLLAILTISIEPTDATILLLQPRLSTSCDTLLNQDMCSHCYNFDGNHCLQRNVNSPEINGSEDQSPYCDKFDTAISQLYR